MMVLLPLKRTGGTGDYQYNWSNGDSGATITGLVTNTYTVTVTDDNGCIAVLSIDLDEPDPLTITFIDVVDVECFGQETGSATAQPAGGTAPYTYFWSNGATGSTASGLGV
jgi:hypothetical protein